MNRLIAVIALFCALCHFVPCFAVVFEDCGSPLAKVTEISVSECGQSDGKCNLVRGTNATILITFVPNTNISQLNVRVCGMVSGMGMGYIRFPTDKPDVCKDHDSGVECPLHKNQKYNYKYTMFIQKKLPPLSVTVKWVFVTDNANVVLCTQFPVKIK